MAIDKAKVVSSVKEMTQNADWREVLDEAPGAANLRIALAFYASKNLPSMTSQQKDEYREFREELESHLNAEELGYLARAFGRMGVDAAKTHYEELLAKRPEEERNALGATGGRTDDAGSGQPQGEKEGGVEDGR